MCCTVAEKKTRVGALYCKVNREIGGKWKAKFKYKQRKDKEDEQEPSYEKKGYKYTDFMITLLRPAQYPNSRKPKESDSRTSLNRQ